MTGHSKWITTKHRKQREILPYLGGWERTLTEPGDIATFRHGDYMIHLIGKHDVHLTAGEGFDAGEMRFYDAAVTIMQSEQPMVCIYENCEFEGTMRTVVRHQVEEHGK